MRSRGVRSVTADSIIIKVINSFNSRGSRETELKAGMGRGFLTGSRWLRVTVMGT